MKKYMPCPFCKHGIVSLKKERRPLVYKGITFFVMSYFYKCFTCFKEFTTTETDEKTLFLLTNQYYRYLKKHEKHMA